MSKRIIFVNRFYAPDLSATSQILTDIAEHLASEKRRVTVLSTRLSYDGQVAYEKRETINDVEVHRLWTSSFGRGNWLGRACDYLTFYLSVCLKLIFFLFKGDVLVAKTDPPMLSIPLGLIARLKRVQLVNWLQDIFPEVALKIGNRKLDTPIIRILLWLRNRSLQKAAMNVVIGDLMHDTVVKMGVAPERVRTIHNFVDDEQIQAQSTHAVQLRQEWGLTESDFVIGYSGNLGRAHDLDTILSVATELKDDREIKFLFIGGGHLRARLQQEIQERDLNNVVLKPYLPREDLPESLSLPNFHWASLIPDLEGYIVPSKAYGVAAAGRPLLMIGDLDGEIGRLVTKYDFGIVVQPGNASEVTRSMLELASNTARMKQLGQNARRFTDLHASRKKAFSLWLELVDTYVSTTSKL